MSFIKRLLKYVFILICLVVTLDAGAVFLFANFRPEIKKADAIIILGAAINSPALYNRTTTGLQLYREGKAPVMVLSGGRISDKDISEAGFMKKVITKAGEPAPNLIIEDQSGNTFENFKNSRAKLPNAKSIIIVSDKYHLARSVFLALRNGFYPVYWTSPDGHYYSKDDWQYYYMREFFAILGYIPKFVTN